MRTATFLGLCGLIAGGIVILLQIPIVYFGARKPDFEWEFLNAIVEFTGTGIFKLIEVAAVLPVVMYLLNPLNRKLRVWRKMRGRTSRKKKNTKPNRALFPLPKRKNSDGLEG